MVSACAMVGTEEEGSCPASLGQLPGTRLLPGVGGSVRALPASGGLRALMAPWVMVLCPAADEPSLVGSRASACLGTQKTSLFF